MPLHLLGKKSWNVYNQDNISRVRQDEADAQARTEAAERRMQEEDAARRIAILRGETVAPLPEAQPDAEEHDHRRSSKRDAEETYATRDRKRKRRSGEDDTDRDIRYARQDREAGLNARETTLGRTKKGGDRSVEAPLQDHAGHIQLFAAPDEKHIRKNAEAEAEKAKKKKREEDLVTMKFSNAAGHNNGMRKPWYAAASAASEQTATSSASRNEMMLANVWGNEDPRRKEREAKKIVSSDPFATMQNAQRQLKQSEKDKERWQKRQKIEIEELKREQRSRRRDDDEVDSLDGFSLDAPEVSKQREGGERKSKHRHRHHHHHHHRRHRSRDRDGEGETRHTCRARSRKRDRTRHRSRSRERNHTSRHRE